jgi:hypothetical protein
MLLSLILVIGCENDDNTIDPIPKYHDVYPVFHVQIDNGFRMIGVDSAQVVINPSVGWPGPVYTDPNGFFGALANGTFIDQINTIPDGDTVIVDTTYQVFGFTPSQTYTFTFNRTEPFLYKDSFRAVYAITVDSQWVLLGADTVDVTVAPDPSVPLERILTNVSIIDGTENPPPDSTVDQTLLYGFWLDTAFVITNPDDTVDYPPDSTYTEDITWGYWFGVDTTFLPPDEEIWCTLDSAVEVLDTIENQEGFPMVVVDTVYYYGNCDPKIDSVKTVIYRDWGWGTYPGGNTNEPPIAGFDTIVHFTFPDTTKGLLWDGAGMKIFTWEILPDSSDTISDTIDVTIEYIHDGATQSVNELSIQVTMPPVEVFPEYEFIIREVPAKK